MREIKFEYIFKENYSDKLHKKIFTIEQLEDYTMEILLLEKEWKIIARRQFTGLTDKNGVEIYEGDIVRTVEENHILEVRFGLHNVGFDSDCAMCATANGFHFKWIKEGDRDFLGTPYMKHLGKEWSEHYLGEEVEWESELEVIGNIYSNPELLNN